MICSGQGADPRPAPEPRCAATGVGAFARQKQTIEPEPAGKAIAAPPILHDQNHGDRPPAASTTRSSSESPIWADPTMARQFRSMRTRSRFLGGGVRTHAVAERARVDLMITHEPAQMFVTDLPRAGDR